MQGGWSTDHEVAAGRLLTVFRYGCLEACALLPREPKLLLHNLRVAVRVMGRAGMTSMG